MDISNNYVAIFIGISRYDGYKGYENMSQSFNDIVALCHLVYLDYDSVHLMYSKNLDDNQKSIMKNLDRANIYMVEEKSILDAISDICSSDEINDKTCLWIHFSGHGEGGQGDWKLIVPSGAATEKINELSVNKIREILIKNDITKAFITIDACQTGRKEVDSFSDSDKGDKFYRFGASTASAPDKIYSFYWFGASTAGGLTTNRRYYGAFTEALIKSSKKLIGELKNDVIIDELVKSVEPPINNSIERPINNSIAWCEGSEDIKRSTLIRKCSENVLIGSEEEFKLLWEKDVPTPILKRQFWSLDTHPKFPDKSWVQNIILQKEYLHDQSKIQDSIISQKQNLHIFVSCDVSIVGIRFLIDKGYVPVDDFVTFLIECCAGKKYENIYVILNCALTEDNIRNDFMPVIERKAKELLFTRDMWDKINIYMWKNAINAKISQKHLFYMFSEYLERSRKSRSKSLAPETILISLKDQPR